jgi:MFS family permease
MMHPPKLASKITSTLFLAQSFGSAGFIAVATVSSIVAAQLSGNPAFAGLPSAVYQFGSALAAPALSYLMDRAGRRNALSLGLLTGIAGAGLATQSIIAGSFPTFILGMSLMGVAQASVQLGRFVAAEVHPPAERGRAISNVVIGGTAGAVLGPLLVGPTGQMARQSGVDELAGPFAIAVVLLFLAGFLVFIRLRPDPREIGQAVSRLYPASGADQGPARPLSVIFRQPAPLAALAAMVLGQVIMVILMVITALHMKQHQHMLTDVSLVISSHTFGMFAFSVVSGRLADRWGRERVILTGAGTLILACIAAPLSPNVLPLAVALFLLGLGWNFCYVGGSSLLSDYLLPAERARAQGFNDLLIGLASGAGSFGSGLIFASLGYGLMGLIGAVLALFPMTLTLRWLINRNRLALAE